MNSLRTVYAQFIKSLCTVYAHVAQAHILTAHVAHAGRWGASCGALTLRGGKNMQRRGAAGLLLLGLLLGTCLAGSRAQWVCMGGHLPGGGRDRGVRGSPNKTPLTSPDALFYLHHLRSCAMCPVGAVATGGISTTGGGGGVDFSSFCVGLSHLVCLLCCRVWELPGIGLLLLASSSIFNTSSSHFPVALLVLVFWVTNVHFPRTRCRLLSGVLTWLLLRGWPSYMGKLLYLFWVLHNPLFPQPEAMQVDSGPPLVRPPLPAGVEEELRAVFGEDMSVDELLRADTGGHHHTCPVVGCCRHAGGNRPGWGTFGSLRAHVDQHLSGELPGRPTESWFQVNRLGCCNVCGLTISTRVQGQTHPRCHSQRDHVLQPPPPHQVSSGDLPDLSAVFCTPIRTKEHLPKSLLPMVKAEYGKLVAAVLQTSRPDAWDPPNGTDTAAHKAAREAWVHFFMFPKCVLRQFGRGQRPQQAYHFTKSLLVRWRLGERAGLWSEACQASTPKPRGARAHPSPDTIRAHKVLEAERLAGLGRPSQAIHRLQSPGLAHDTPQVKQKLLAKFPPVPPHTPAADTLHMPPPPIIPIPLVAKAIRSFSTGTGPGPDGLRADLLKALMGNDEDDGILPLYRDLVQLLVDGLAPAHLRPWLGGGQLIGIGKVDPQGNPIPLDQDARPIVMGATWRKVAFKCTLALDKQSIRDRLLPTQLAVGVSCGAEVMVHAARHWIHQNRQRNNYVLLQKRHQECFQ